MSGRNILLIGSSGGIGSQLATMFPEDTVFHHYHKEEPINNGYKVQADITVYADVEAMLELLLKKFERIDVLINVAGISINGFAHKMAPELWRSVIEVNLIGAFNVIRAVLPSMRANRFGRIITASSVVFQRPVVGTSAYSAAKSALLGLTRAVALENANMGVTCNCIALGYFDAGLLYQIPEAQREEIREAIPMKRFGLVNELHKTIQYVLETEYTTGQCLSLNGGLYMS